MKAIAHLILVATILAPVSLAQTKASPATPPPPYEIRISAEVAEKLLIHKVDPVGPHSEMSARIRGTVVVGFDIDKNGNVLHTKVISGPQMLRKAVLDAVRKYKYKPYLLNGRAVEVETTASVTVSIN